MTPLELIPVKLDECLTTAAFVNSVYRGPEAEKSWTSEASFIGGQRTDPEMIRQIISDPNQVILRNTGPLIKCCVHLRKEETSAWLGMLTVGLSEQGTGLGKTLLREAECFARLNWGTQTIKMNVIAFREELISWYERRGYVQSSQRAPFPYGDSRFGIPLRDGIEFMIMTKDLA
jgi:GNAT superfamily N-acetyltransferase